MKWFILLLFFFNYCNCLKKCLLEENKNEFISEDCNCKNKVNSKIIGNTTAALHEFPWVVFITIGSTTNVCTGFLINKNTVITAAHCLKYLTDEKITIHLGSSNITSKEMITFKPECYNIHTNYTAGEYDIGYIKLKNVFHLI